VTEKHSRGGWIVEKVGFVGCLIAVGVWKNFKSFAADFARLH
jgi:hypothetical protein